MKFTSVTLASLIASFCLHTVASLQANSAPFEIYDECGESIGTFYLMGNDINSWIEDEDGYTICISNGGSELPDRRLISAEHAAEVRARRRMHEVNYRTVHDGKKTRTRDYCDSYSESRGYNEDGELVYYYCQKLEGGKIGPNMTLPVIDTDPEAAGIEKHIHMSLNAAAEECGEYCQNSLHFGGVAVGDDTKNRKLRSRKLNAPKEGVVKNLVIPFKFGDHGSRSLPSKSDLNTLMNAMEPVANIAPTGGVKRFYSDTSGGKLQLESVVIDWIQLPAQFDENRCSGAAYGDKHGTNAYFTECLVEVLKEADKVVNFKDFDINNDNSIDAITFIHSSYCAAGCGSANHLIWSHMGALNEREWTSAEGVVVNAYHINPSLSGCEGNKIGTISTIAHETGHFFGLVDLYDRNQGGNGVGAWSTMASCDGFHGSSAYPPLMDPYSKEQLGWGTFTELTTSQNKVTLSPSATHHQYIRITQGFPSGEYLLIENRQPIGFDKYIPAAGLLIWHVDKDKRNQQNDDEGYPGQSNWPQNNKHYMVAVLAGDGEYKFEKQNSGKGDRGDPYNQCLSAQEISPTTVPNTKAYQGGNIRDTGITIKNIYQDAGNNMVFDVCFGSCAAGSEAPPARECCKDKDGWVAEGWNIGGQPATCEKVVANGGNLCKEADSGGVTGFQACCGCKSYPDNIWTGPAGATTPTAPASSPTTPTTPATTPTGCQNDTNWKDNQGDGCGVYTRDYCGEDAENYKNAAGVSANTACCICKT